MKLAAGYAPEPAQQVGLHPDFFCSANDLPALGVSDFESPFAYGTGDGFFTPNEKYLIHRCRMFHNVILLSLILGTTLRNINLAGVSSYCGVFYFTSIPVSRIGFILTGILSDYLRQNKRSKVPAPGQCQGAAWRQVGLAETPGQKILTILGNTMNTPKSNLLKKTVSYIAPQALHWRVLYLGKEEGSFSLYEN